MFQFIVRGSCVFLVSAMLCVASALARSRSAATIHAERWLEIDLYWFNRGDLAASARVASGSVNAALFEGVSGQHGVILNVGWVMDYILDWRGSLTGRIPPPRMKQATLALTVVAASRTDPGDWSG